MEQVKLTKTLRMNISRLGTVTVSNIMTTYSELVDQIRSYTETSSDVLTTTIVNDFINQAELRIFREVDLDVFRAYQFATLTR